jgi:hypothetical protein
VREPFAKTNERIPLMDSSLALFTTQVPLFDVQDRNLSQNKTNKKYVARDDGVIDRNRTLHRSSDNDETFLSAATLSSDSHERNALHLRLDWTRLERLSPIAKQIETMQNDCSITKRGLVWSRNVCGLGSDLHVYGIALCSALEMKNVRLRSIASWIWRDEDRCGSTDGALSDDASTHSPMKCYFPESEPSCPNDSKTSEFTSFDAVTTMNLTQPDGSIEQDSCPTVRLLAGGFSALRAATTEYLFTRVSDLVLKEAQRQIQILFGNNTNTQGKIPKNLITVHVRWGDKDVEMGLSSIAEYIQAIQNIVAMRRTKRTGVEDFNNTVHVPLNDFNNKDDVHILLATEDPEALQQFMKAKPAHWNVYIDQYYTEYLPYRIKTGNVYNAHVINTKRQKGRFGLVALGSLLVAMEANDFVLTTGSNWSRLMNELRKNVIDPRCQNCTLMIDLMKGEYR